MGDVDAFVAQIRYELRSPINTILGYSQLLLEEGDSSALSVAERHVLEGVAGAGKQLLQTVGALLDPAAVTDGIEEYAYRLRYTTRPPLTAIRGCIKALLERHSSAPIGDDLRRINVAAARFFKVTDGLEHTFVSAKGDPPPSVSVTVGDIDTTVQSAGGGSILIIDDEEANRALLSRRLIRQGYSVLVAATGEAGLAIAARESVDVILLDVWLPGASGYEILGRLKSDEVSREIPVLVITAVDRPESVARCLALGADDYLPKPFDPVVLGVRVRSCLAKKRARDFDLAYLRGVARVTAAALAVESGTFVAESLDEVAQRPDPLGNLAGLFQRMAMEVAARQRRLEDQVQQLTIAIDERKKAAQVDEITDSDYFRDLQVRARHFSARRTARSSQSG
ncbi:MAG TPA: response regulator [Vicinamibacterales bacterium]|nr:response regulator [Vicinamibacterales bacterium]